MRSTAFAGAAADDAASLAAASLDAASLAAAEAEADALSLGPGWAKTFMDRVYSRTKVKPMIYTSKSVTSYYDWSAVAPNYKLWVAQYPNYDTVWGYDQHPWTDSNGYGAWKAAGAPVAEKAKKA